MIRVDKLLNAKGLTCSMPIVKTKIAINELEGGHELLKHEEENDVLKFWIKKGNFFNL